MPASPPPPAPDFTTFANIVSGLPRSSKETYTGTNPRTEEALWPVPITTEADVEDAITAATAAFPGWSKTSYDARCEKVVGWSEKLALFKEEFMELLMEEGGKPVGSLLPRLPCFFSLD